MRSIRNEVIRVGKWISLVKSAMIFQSEPKTSCLIYTLYWVVIPWWMNGILSFMETPTSVALVEILYLRFLIIRIHISTICFKRISFAAKRTFENKRNEWAIVFFTSVVLDFRNVSSDSFVSLFRREKSKLRTFELALKSKECVVIDSTRNANQCTLLERPMKWLVKVKVIMNATVSVKTCTDIKIQLKSILIRSTQSRCSYHCSSRVVPQNTLRQCCLWKSCLLSKEWICVSVTDFDIEMIDKQRFGKLHFESAFLRRNALELEEQIDSNINCIKVSSFR